MIEYKDKENFRIAYIDSKLNEIRSTLDRIDKQRLEIEMLKVKLGIYGRIN